MTEQNLKILNAVPLVDVMRGWGFVPKHYAKSSGSAWFLCPWHDDHHESLEVRTVPIKDATDLSFHCWACGEEGFGAIQLAARLMGMPAGKLSAEDLQQVVAELAAKTAQQVARRYLRDNNDGHIQRAPDYKDGPSWTDSTHDGVALGRYVSSRLFMAKTFVRRDMAHAGRQERAFARGERRRKRGRREGDLLLLQSVIRGENNLRRNLRACDEAVEAEKRLEERVREKNEKENEKENADKA